MFRRDMIYAFKEHPTYGKGEKNMDRIKKSIGVITALALICLLLPGCGQRPVALGEGENENGEAGQAQAMATGLANVLGINEEIWETEFAVQDEQVKNVKIYASLEIPNVDHMSVIGLKPKEFTEEEKKTIADSLFDSGSIDIQDKLPLWYIEARLSELEQQLKVFEYCKADPYYPWSDEDESAYEETKKAHKEMEALKDNTASEKTPLPVDLENVFLGEAGGMHYMLAFHGSGFSYRAANFDSFLHHAETTQNDVIYCVPGSVAASKNICTMTEQEAKNQAQDFVNGMGLSGYTVGRIEPLMWVQYDDTNYEEWMDGYHVVLVRNINGVDLSSTDYSNVMFKYMHGKYNKDSFNFKYAEETINIFINDAGIYQCNLNYPYELEDMLSESTTMLSYEAVKSTIQSIIETEPNPYFSTLDSDRMQYTKLKLGYMRLENDGEYALVPVWQLLGMKNGSIDYLICINAIDGSEINIVEELIDTDL